MKTILALSVAFLLPISAAQADTPAGTIVLVVGDAWAQAGGQRLPLARGARVETGQKLITGEGGHIHVRMNDGGLVAIRPHSELEIQVFDYDPANPKAGKVRYSLRHGVARSVTGAIGEANKESFRFNTPVAAIGVRGTDFVAFSDATTTRVSVKSGAVVVAALSDICRAEGFGACLEHAITLRAEGKANFIEVNLHDKTPQLLQDKQHQLPDQLSPPLATEPLAVLQENRRAKDILANGEIEPPRTKDVYWGRWDANAPGISGDTASELISAGKKIHVASNTFGLGVTQKVDRLPERWQAQFQLAGGDAYVLANGAYSPATLAGGSLSIDMAAGQFSSHATVKEGSNTHNVDALGRVYWRGYLLSDDTRSNSKFTGVVNADLKTVGSVFEKSLNNSRTLTGTMIWQR